MKNNAALTVDFKKPPTPSAEHRFGLTQSIQNKLEQLEDQAARREFALREFSSVLLNQVADISTSK